jgi:dipeptide transport system ATP-binding protein
VQPELRAWKEGRICCHYPLGDPQRAANIAADHPVRQR